MLKANGEAKTYSFKGSTISKQQKRQLVSHKTLILIFHLKITLKIFGKSGLRLHALLELLAICMSLEK